MPGPQVGEGGIAAHLEVHAEDHPALRQPGGAPGHHVLFQLEAGNAVDQQAPGPVVPVIDGDQIAPFPQPLRRRQARRARADDPHGLGPLAQGLQRLDPALFPGRVGDELLHRADGDGLPPGLLDDAGAFAQAVLRADAAADLRHGGGGGGQGIGVLQPALGGHLQPVGDVVVQRTGVLAERHAALGAAGRLLLPPGEVVVRIDLAEVVGPLRGLALGRGRPGRGDKFQQAFGHDGVSRAREGCSTRPIRGKMTLENLMVQFAD